MTTITARTADVPMPIGDASDVLLTIPAGVPVELQAGPDGTTLVVRRSTVDAIARPTRAQIEDDNAAGLKRILAASGSAR